MTNSWIKKSKISDIDDIPEVSPNCHMALKFEYTARA